MVIPKLGIVFSVILSGKLLSEKSVFTVYVNSNFPTQFLTIGLA